MVNKGAQKMKEYIKNGLKKIALSGLSLLYDIKAKRHVKVSSKYREEEKMYREALKSITRDKSGSGLKYEFKKLGQQLLLDYLIAYNYSKANKHEKKSSACERKKQEYTNRLEELSKPKPENTGNENRLENIISNPTNPSPETITNKGYYDSIKEFYQKYESENDTLTSTIGKILAGDYIENGKRIWYWKDRVKKIEDYARRGSISEKAQKEIFTILKCNDYFMKNKTEELSKLNNLILNDIRKEVEQYLKKIAK